MPFQQTIFDANRSPGMAVRLVKQELWRAAKESGWSREQILDRAREIARTYGLKLVKGNGGLTIDTLEKWLNKEDDTRVPSLKAITVLCLALETIEPLRPVVELCGGRIIDEYESRLLDWAKAYRAAKKQREKMKIIERELCEHETARKS